MQIEDISKGIEIVNGEELYLLDIEKAHNIQSGQIIDDISIGEGEMFELFIKMIRFVAKHNDFELSLIKYRIGSKIKWNVYILYRINNTLQRVQIKNVDCEYCVWKGDVADSTELSLYTAVKECNYKDALHAAWSLPEVKCPACGKKIRIRAIWAEDY